MFIMVFLFVNLEFFDRARSNKFWDQPTSYYSGCLIDLILFVRVILTVGHNSQLNDGQLNLGAVLRVN